MTDLANVADVVRARGGTLTGPVHLVRETVSTNDDAKAAAKDGAPHGSIWVAESQTGGRGRQGRVWVSPPGENLLFSVLLRIGCQPARVPPLALVAGLAVRDAVAKHLENGCVRVKWPNDVVVVRADGQRKVAGVLVESAVAGSKVEYVVVGVGVNVHTRAFPAELAEIATSIACERGATDGPPPARSELLADIVARLDHDAEHVAHRGLGLVHARLEAHDALRGRRVTVEGVSGDARGIDAEGRLVLGRDDGSVIKIASGEARLAR